jgi:hypothetical protein
MANRKDRFAVISILYMEKCTFITGIVAMALNPSLRRIRQRYPIMY